MWREIMEIRGNQIHPVALADVFDVSSGEQPAGWRSDTPSPALAPRFFFDTDTHLTGSGSLAMAGAGNANCFGFWAGPRVLITPGRYYRMRVVFRFEGMGDPNLHVLNCVLWHKSDPHLRPAEDHVTHYRRLDGDWIEGTETLQAPAEAAEAELRLYLRYSAEGSVWWDSVELRQVAAPEPRVVRLAVYQGAPSLPKEAPVGEAIAYWESVVRRAGQTGTDLLLLPEIINAAHDAHHLVEHAEPLPGGDFFERLRQAASEHRMWLCAGLMELDNRLSYNSAVLVDREGRLVGKYRKIHPYFPEEPSGVVPGDEVPVFPTEFGLVGIMVCYDSWWPETARLLALQGAEVILFPNAGYEMKIMPARAIDNAAYLAISSLHHPAAVLDTRGDLLALRTTEGLAWATPDLNHKPPCHPNAGGSMNCGPGGRRAARNARSLKLYEELAREVARWESDNAIIRR